MPLLPLSLLLKRLTHEERDLKEHNIWFARQDLYSNEEYTMISMPTVAGVESVPVVVKYTVKIEADGYYKPLLKKPKPLKEHIFEIYILRNYPFPDTSRKYRLGAPIRLLWLSNIFHPNIAPGPSFGGTGVVCWYVLKKWLKMFNLLTIIEGVKALIENPEPDDPLRYKICKAAAEWFNKKKREKGVR